MSVDYLRLFNEGRLNPNVPEHALRIEARLASLKVESEADYNKYRSLYDALVCKCDEPKKEEKKEEPKEVEAPAEEVVEEETAEEPKEEKPKKKKSSPKKS